MPVTSHAEIIHPSFRATQEHPGSADVICTGPELADIFGFENDRRIRQLCQEGMPRTGRGQYPRNRCVQWYAKFMWKSALKDRRFSDIRTVQMKEKRRAYRTMILAFQAMRAEGSQIHKNTCRRIWQRDLRKIEIELDRLAVDIASDPRLMRDDVKWWGQICARFDVARNSLIEFRESRADLFGRKKFQTIRLPSDLTVLLEGILPSKGGDRARRFAEY
jgi:hypothetical protein